MPGTIYSAFDAKTGMSYVGQTWRTVEERAKEHPWESPTHFHNALKARPEDFTWAVLVTGVETQEELDRLELEWTAKLNALHPHGYVMRAGEGKGRQSEASKAKMRGPRPSLQGDNNPLRRPEVAAKVSAAMMGNKRALGKKHSEASRARHSAANRDRKAVKPFAKGNQLGSGWERSTETRLRMAEARRAWWARKRAQQ